MKITIQEENGPKQIFLTFKEAASFIGISSPNIYHILKRPNPRYRRRSDGNVFFIKEERDEKLCSIDAEDYQSFQQIRNRFGISPTVFLNQISRKQNSFLDQNEISHFVSDFSPEIEKMIDAEKRNQMNKKILSQSKNCQMTQNSFDVLVFQKI